MTTLRADARLNYERVLTAAAAVFAEHGLSGTVPQIADRAGVGKATVYRSFPTKDDLVTAIARQHFADLEKRTLDALVEPNADRALRDYIVDLFGTLAHNRLLADVLAEGATVSSTRILDLLADLLTTARTSGYIRPDVTVTDLRVLLCGAILQLIRIDIRHETAWRRYGELVVNALRPMESDQTKNK